jgi:DNA-binding transcriptional MerR regulator
MERERTVRQMVEPAARRPTVHDLVAETGESVRTIHYWTTMGVIPKPSGAGLQASYDPDTPTRIRAIRRLQAAQLRMDAIREVMQSATPQEVRAWAEGAVPGRIGPDALAAGPPDRRAAGPADRRLATGATERALRREIAPGVEVLVSERASLREPAPRMHARLDALLAEARRVFGRADAPLNREGEES